jgi:hypothetical protein
MRKTIAELANDTPVFTRQGFVEYVLYKFEICSISAHWTFQQLSLHSTKFEDDSTGTFRGSYQYVGNELAIGQ